MSDIKTLDQLKHYLYLAMQLEHATIPPYLTALYSIKFGTNPDATQILRVIAVEEMLHLTLAANILNAVGGKPDLTQNGFVPRYPTRLPDGETDFEVSLLPFSKAALQTFLQIERPAMLQTGKKRLLQKTATMAHRELRLVPPDNPDLYYYSIGEFYQAIEHGIAFLENEAHANNTTIFTGDPARQITSEFYYSGGGNLIPVYDLKSAQAAIKLIITQGEGETHNPYSDEGELSHYYRFMQLDLGRYYQPGDKEAPTGPKLTVDWSAVQPMTPNLKLDQLPAKSVLHQRAVDFNQQYADFLAVLTRAFDGQPRVLLEAVPMMFRFRDRAVELLRNPVAGLQTNAGPTFEMP